MDAEQMLDQLCAAAADTASCLKTEAADAMNDVLTMRRKIEPLIRSGLALQRLERWLPEGHEFNIGRAYGVYGAQVWKMIGEHRVSGTGQTLLGVINSTLDAAGAE